MFKNILVPTDGSEVSQKAALKGVALAKAVGAKITAFFAAPPATPIVYRHSLPVGYVQPEEHQRLIDAATAKALGDVEAACKDAGVDYAGLSATSDFPEDEILKAAARSQCDLIVMGSHGHGGLRGALIGSVAQKVLGKATVPVMIVKS
ncbi:MAG: universal stress protein [Hyphomicrobiaceae bacterium]|nr:universal stress protein [Hyphomicrobiaceae bacterium]